MIDSLAGSGGAERGLVREITRFSRDVDQHVVRLFEPSELQSELEGRGIPVTWLGLRASWGAYAWPLAVLRLTRLIRRFRPDVVHSSLFASNVVAQTAARLTRVRVVSTFVLSGEEALLRAYQPGANTWKARTLRGLAGVSARWAGARFRAITEDAARTNALLLGVPLDRITVVPRGVPLDPPGGEIPSRSELGLPEGPRLILNVGRMASQKGQIHLVRAFARVRERVTDTHLVVVGREGNTADLVRAEVERLGLAGSVTITGYRRGVDGYLAHAALFAFPSLMEGLGTALLEAMAAGLPVIAFDIPPVREVTDRGRVARLVPVGDESALAEAMVEVLEGGDDGLGEAARRLVEERYGLDQVAARLESLLKSVAGR